MDTSGTPADDSHGRVLASDAEREATVERLRVACADGRLTVEEMSDRSGLAYRARTAAELAELTRDLPVGSSAAPTGITVVDDGSDETDSYIAVFGGSERKGHWRVPRRAKAVAVFGGVLLDMRSAEFAAAETFIDAVAVFGGVEINVPEGVEVRMSGFAVFGGKSSQVPPPRPGAPVLNVRCRVVFGGIEVKTKKTLNEKVTAVRERLGPPRPPLPPAV